MKYIVINKTNFSYCVMLNELMLEYISETDLHSGTSTPKEIIPKIIKSMIEKIDENRFLQIVLVDGEPAGFCYAKIDRMGDKGDIRPGWGYIMEFFVRKPHRRRGIGRELVRHCENFFSVRKVKNVWLTADAVTGIPFWKAVGYSDTGEISKENNQNIFIKSII